MTPYPHQVKGLRAIRSALDGGERAVLYVLPTGGGKGVMIGEMAAALTGRRERILMMAHRREIVGQLRANLFARGITSGLVAPGAPMTQDSAQVGMVQTIVKRLATMRRPDLIVPDEAHHCLEDNSYGAILRYWKDVPVVGYTATPERLDGRGLGESFGTMIQGPTMRELVRDGYLSPPVLYAPPNNLLGDFHVTRGDFDIGEQEEAMDTRTRRGRQIVGDVIDHYREHLDRLPVVVFCVSIKHSELMAEEFRAAGYVAAHVWGNMDKRDRERAIGGLGDGSVQVVTSCDVISEGVDVPVMAGAILLRRTLSLGLYLQQAGRALRLCEGKTQAVILDHAGNYQIHGHVLADREWSLAAKSRRERGEEPPKTTKCPMCFGVWPGRPRTCPACGFDFGDEVEGFDKATSRDVRVIEGQLVKAGIKGEDALDLASMMGQAQKMSPGDRARFLARKGLGMLEATKHFDGSPTAEAWRARGGRV